MTRIFGEFAYGAGPRTGCFWDRFATDVPEVRPALQGEVRADVCIIGAGFTGLNAALALAEQGTRVVVLDAQHPGWGASGRNGGFCCLGGGKIGEAALRATYGTEAAEEYRAAECAAVAHVGDLLKARGIDADTHSEGETLLAHTPRHMDAILKDIDAGPGPHGVTPRVTRAEELAQMGMSGPFFGAVTTPIGFALNPRRYLDGLLAEVCRTGAAVHADSAAQGIDRDGAGWAVTTAGGKVRAGAVLIATNGYSSEHVPAWMAARYMPTQSTVLVTRPITDEEQRAQGWTTRQMCYDSRNLVHYFRLMPDGRMLFGMRGGIFSSARAEARSRAAVRRHFRAMFPAWAGVEIEHEWSGMVCLSPKRLPYAGPIPGQPGLFAAYAYHGNGVSMGSYLGRMIGNLIAGGDARAIPEAVRADPQRFPFGRFRRILMPPLYASLKLADL